MLSAQDPHPHLLPGAWYHAPAASNKQKQGMHQYSQRVELPGINYFLIALKFLKQTAL